MRKTKKKSSNRISFASLWTDYPSIFHKASYGIDDDKDFQTPKCKISFDYIFIIYILFYFYIIIITF